jgi:Predicted periplasmic or secreted lipoprotein
MRGKADKTLICNDFSHMAWRLRSYDQAAHWLLAIPTKESVMTTNSRLGKIIPVTGATLIALALGGVSAQAADMAQDSATMQQPPAMQVQPQPGMQPQATAESAGKAVDDSIITTKVKAELVKEPSLKSLNIHVATLKGVVHLTGHVANRSEASRAVQVAQAVEGVKMVMSDLRVQG